MALEQAEQLEIVEQAEQLLLVFTKYPLAHPVQTEGLVQVVQLDITEQF